VRADGSRRGGKRGKIDMRITTSLISCFRHRELFTLIDERLRPSCST